MSDFNENDSSIIDGQSTSYNDIPESNVVEGGNISFSDNAEGYEDAPIKSKPAKNGLTSLIIGIIFTIVNCVMGISLLSGNVFVFGGIFIIFPILGLINGIQAFKAEGAQKIMGIFGFILNVFTTLGALLFVIAGIIAKFN